MAGDCAPAPRTARPSGRESERYLADVGTRPDDAVAARPTAPPRPRIFLGILVATAAIAGIRFERWGVVIVSAAVAAAGSQVIWLFPSLTHRIGRGFAFVGRGSMVGVGLVISGLVMLVVVIPISLVSRLFGYSPLDPGWSSPSTAWLVVDQRRIRTPDGKLARPRSMAVPDVPRTRSVRRRGRLRLVVPVLAIAAVVLLSSDGRWSFSGSEGASEAPETFPRAFEEDPAFEDAPWARNLRLGLLEAWQNLEFNAALGGWRVKDLTSEYINIADGERATTSPPPELGEPVTVWFFGGSAAFGAGQRDAHTLPSELVQRAADDGVALEVHNLAVPATVNWQSAMLLIALLQWEDEPDLVVFYDGANDLALQDVLTERGRGGSDEPASLVDGELDEILGERAEESGVAADIVPPSDTVTPDETPSPGTAGRLVYNRYRNGVEIVRQFCAAASVPVEFFWQPELRIKEPLSEADRDTLADLDVDNATLERAREISGAARAGLSALDVTDLSSAFDGQTQAIYWDTVHTNEVGARIVAGAIYEELEPTLAQLHEGGG